MRGGWERQSSVTVSSASKSQQTLRSRQPVPSSVHHKRIPAPPSPDPSSSGEDEQVNDEEEMSSGVMSLTGRAARPFRSRRKGTGPSTGLRAVTMLVVEMLRQKSAVSYEEIANDVCNRLRTTDEASEARNIRRRAYDVINVMAAVGFIRKHKKRLFSVQSLVDANGTVSMDVLVKEKEERKNRIAAKESCIQSVLQQSYRKQMQQEHQVMQQQEEPERAEVPVVTIKSEPQDDDEADVVVNENHVNVQIPESYPPAYGCVPEGQANVLVQEIGYMYRPYEYYGHHYAEYEDPNLQDVSHAQEIEGNYNRDPVEAILSAFY